MERDWVGPPTSRSPIKDTRSIEFSDYIHPLAVPFLERANLSWLRFVRARLTSITGF
jgi:hypothetical protein